MIILKAYLVIAIVLSIYGLVVSHFDKGFDKFVHDSTNGTVEFTPTSRIVAPLVASSMWPIIVYKLIRKAVHG